MQVELQVPAQKRIEEETKISSREKQLLLLGALLLGLAFDYLFFAKTLGVSYPIFCVSLLGYFLYTARGRVDLRSKMGWFLFAVIVLLSLTFALHTNMFLRALNFISLPLLIVAYTLIVTNQALEWDRPVFITWMLERVFALAIPAATKPFRFLREALTARDEGAAGSSTRKHILIGLLLALPILLLVIPLLASADMVFGHYLNNLADIITFPEHGFLRLLLVALVSLYVFGYAWSFKFPGHERLPTAPGRQRTIDPVVLITLLTIVNLVYLLFSCIQFSYLYAGASKVLPPGFSYAEYARRGFFELVAVTLVNFLLMLFTMKVTDKTKRAARAVNVLLSTMVAFTGNMLFAAHYKLSLYEQSYGYTELRIYVHMFMLFMAAVFVIALLKIWWQKVPLSKGAIVSALVIYLTINFMNVHGLCARNNIDRYYKTGEIDTVYLSHLSHDAVPELIRLMDDQDPVVSGKITAHLGGVYLGLQQDSKWMEFNLSSARAKQQLQGSLP